MNYTTAVMLINERIRAVKVIYETEVMANSVKRTMFKTLNKDVDVDDFVVVPTDSRHNMTVAKVVEVDVEVDFDCVTPVQWLIGTVDTDYHTTLLEDEAEWVDVLKASEKRKKREEIKANMLAMHDDVKMSKLSICHKK